MNLNAHQLQALRLIENGAQLTNHGNALVSRQTKSLLELGLIDYTSHRWIAYALTNEGVKVLYKYNSQL
jgi:hypothetical protein